MSTDEARLQEAFAHFNSVTDELIKAYQLLERQVAELNHQLQQANDEIIRKSIANESLLAKLSALLAIMPVGVIELGPDSRILAVNHAAEHMLPNLGAGMSWRPEQWLQQADDGSYYAGDDHQKRMTLMTCQLPESGAFILILDVTDLHRLHAQLAQQEKLASMGKMAASLAHQVRTPLAAALLYAANLTREDLPDGGRERFAGKVVDRLKALESLVQDMLAFVRGSEGGHNVERFALQELLVEIDGVVRPLMCAKHLAWAVESEGCAAYLLGVKSELVGAFVNLVENAVSHSPEGGRIGLYCRLDGDCLVMTVEDEGCGVPPERVSQIFDPFFTTRANGTGLGLAIVKRVVEDMKGGIAYRRADSVSVFEVRLPVVSNA